MLRIIFMKHSGISPALYNYLVWGWNLKKSVFPGFIFKK